MNHRHTADGTPAVCPRGDVLCFSHLRWDFVFQRPQQIASRWARDHRVWFWEEPLRDADRPYVELKPRGGVQVLVPHVPPGLADETAVLRQMLSEYYGIAGMNEPIGWYWTPMMRAVSDHLALSSIVWDCMDELTAFKDAPPDLLRWEGLLLEDADVVFTGGHSLYQAKRNRHGNVHPFPSSVDVAHFAKARDRPREPADQATIPGPRIGWFGVIDERTDFALLDAVARARPEWHFVMLGPVTKVDEADLPRRPNLHWLGMKPYEDLPAYVAHWDVAILPFAHNPSTKFISPTKTPEYLAAGKPVVSTSITDVVRPYGAEGMVWIADGARAFERAIAEALVDDATERLARADAFLAEMSWDSTVSRMQDLVWSATRPAVAAAR
jgi:UDP-galactopyranose mutase